MAYFILSLKHSTQECPAFWRANNAGYTNSPFMAGIYTEHQIRSNPEYYNNGYSTVAIRLTDSSMEAIGFKVSVDWVKVDEFFKKSLSLKDKRR